MGKAVINVCYGGFGLSTKAIEYMISKGLEEKYYKVNEKYDPNKKEDDFNPKYVFETYEIPRHHPLLIEAVEVLGEEANGFCASLKVVEFYGKMYIVDEYDGMEGIQIPNDIYWCNVNEL